jgi:hypothetical protein
VHSSSVMLDPEDEGIALPSKRRYLFDIRLDVNLPEYESLRH